MFLVFAKSFHQLSIGSLILISGINIPKVFSSASTFSSRSMARLKMILPTGTYPLSLHQFFYLR